jgi:glyoxylase-like metal-dependent hydrolase (beta-lactamase superfamily II)
MRVHHLNAISTCPLGGKLMDGRTESILRRGHLACHCVLVEMPTQLVLIDTGLGLRDVAEPHERLSKFFLFLVKPEFREEMTAVRQIQRLGYDPKDVRHIVLSHLDFDHAGGLDDFPHALVHLLDEEEHAATEQRTVLDRMRYRPAQWSSRDRWRMYEASGEAWHGFPAVRDLEGVGPDILMVPLIGHTLGHAGIAVRSDRGWLLDAGDAYFYHREMDTEPYCTPGLRLYQWMMQKDGAQRLGNQRRLRELVHSAADVTVFCSHDLDEMERLSGRSVELPAEAFFARRDVATATTSSSA